jgi:hypothetical protein
MWHIPSFSLKEGLDIDILSSLLLFQIIVEGLNRSLKEATKTRNLKGVNVDTSYYVIHLVFFHDFLIFFEGSRRMVENIREIITLFREAIGMKLNIDKSTISLYGISENEKYLYSQFFAFHLL